MTMLLSLALSAALLLSPALAAESGFSDVPDEAWYAPHVALCREKGLLTGTGDGRFTPQGVVNTDEALVMAARVLWQADGGVGPLPKGPSAEEFRSLMGEDAATCSFAYDLETAQRYSALWSWDGLTYLAQRAKEEGASLSFLEEGVVYPTSRQTFFQALAFAARGLELPAINEIEAVPGTQDAGILTLYRAGILSGTDTLGSFDGHRTLTRAEAAVALARIAQPQLRQVFSPQSSPYRGYTLTHLMDGSPNVGICNTGLCGLDVGFLNLEGTLYPWPEGGTPGHALGDDQDFVMIGVYDLDTPNPYDTKMGILDRNGRYVVPLGAYTRSYPAADGHFLGMDLQPDGGEQWYLLGPDGTQEAVFPHLDGQWDGWLDFNQGLLPYPEKKSGQWGYVDQAGQWAMVPTWANASPFSGGYAIVQNWKGLYGVIDTTGQTVLPLQYTWLDPFQNSPGYEGTGLFWYELPDGTTGWISPDATTFPPESTQRATDYQNGFARVFSPSVRSVYFLDLTAQRVSETFDWAGPIGANGAGFVGLDGKIYRIQFDPTAP